MLKNRVRVYKNIEIEDTVETKSKPNYFICAADIAFPLLAFFLSRAGVFASFYPFGVTFAAASYKKKNAWLTALCVILGVITAGAGTRVLQYIFSLAVLNCYKIIIDKKDALDDVYLAAFTAVSNLIGGVMVLLLNQQTLHALFLTILESALIFSGVLLFTEVMPIVNQDIKCIGTVRQKSLFGHAAFFALIVSGVGDVLNFGAINLCEILCSVLILCFAGAGGVYGGLCSGIAVGCVAAMSDTDVLSIIGIYSVCGLISGYANKGGKFIAAAAYFLAALAFGLFSTVFIFGQLKLVNVAIASLVYSLIPKNVVSKFFVYESDCLGFEGAYEHENKIKDIFFDKLRTTSQIFSGISKTIEELSDVKNKDIKPNYSKIIDVCVNQTCSSCSMCVYCWDKESEKTGKNFSKIIEKLKQKGYIDTMDFEREFRKKCINAETFAAQINHNYAIERLNSVWSGQLNETKYLLECQYKDFAKVMNDISDDVENRITNESKFKNDIILYVKRCASNISDAEMYIREDMNYDVELYFSELDDSVNLEALEKCVSKCLGHDMRASVVDETHGSIRFEPMYNYMLRSSIATLKKNSECVSGDHYAVYNIKNNRCVLMISDGMGSGEYASLESTAAVQMVKKLLTVGFDVESSIRLVNSALVLKLGKESFATVDIAVVDLLSGKLDAYKVGGAHGYIKRKNKLELMNGGGLPIGILSDVNIYKNTYRIEADDYLILLSDGIAEVKMRDGALFDFIKNLTVSEPEDMAKAILNFSIENTANKAEDDITVLVAKIVDRQKD